MSSRRRAGVLAVNVLGTVCVLALLEGVARLVVPADGPAPLQGEAAVRYRGLIEPHPTLFWTLRPDATLEGSRWTNALGLRDRPVPDPAPGQLRILALGESTTFGDGIAMHERYTEVLARELPRLAERRIVTINAGVPGYTLFQGVTWLRERGLALAPDAVLLYFGYNDFLEVSYRTARDGDARGSTDRELYAQRRRPLARALWTLERSSRLARWALGAARSGEVARGERRRVPAEDRRWLLERLRALCAEHGIVPVVVIPWYRHFDLHVPLLRELRDAPDVVLVDLPRRLREVERAPYFLDTLHPNAAGHRLIGREIVEVLRREEARFSAPAGAG